MRRNCLTGAGRPITVGLAPPAAALSPVANGITGDAAMSVPPGLVPVPVPGPQYYIAPHAQAPLQLQQTEDFSEDNKRLLQSHSSASTSTTTAGAVSGGNESTTSSAGSSAPQDGHFCSVDNSPPKRIRKENNDHGAKPAEIR